MYVEGVNPKLSQYIHVILQIWLILLISFQKYFKAQQVTQKRSYKQYAVAMTNPNRMIDLLGLQVIRDMLEVSLL